MKILFELISKVTIKIDRIDISVPRKHKNRLYQLLDSYGHKRYSKRYNGNLFHGFKIAGCKVILSYPINPKYSYPNKNKCYVRLLQPTEECQNTIKNIFEFIVGNKSNNNEIKLKQIEVAYDIYTHDINDLKYIEQFFNHHCVLRYGKKDSYTRFLTTRYIGSKGNVHKGTIGIRIYIKSIAGKEFYRFEVQLNRRYIKDHGISFHDFPLIPRSFDVIKHFSLLNDFSDRGIKNLAKKILKVEGFEEQGDKVYNKKFERKKAHVKVSIIGGRSGPKKRILNQLEALNNLLKENGLSTNYRNYFVQMPFVKEYIFYLSDILLKEDSVSKRICFCQV